MARVLVATLLALILSGCFDAPSQNPNDNQPLDAGPRLADGSPAPLSMSWTECANIVGYFPHDLDSIRALLPEGLDPYTYPQDPTATHGLLGVAARECAGFRDVWIYVQVTAGEPLAHPAGGNLYFPLRIIATNSSLVDTMRAWGLTAYEHSDDITIEVMEGQTLRVGTAKASSGTLRVELTTTIQGDGSLIDVAGGRLFGAENGTIEGAADLDAVKFLIGGWDRGVPGGGEATAFIEGASIPGLPPSLTGTSRHFWGPYSYDVTYVNLTAGAESDG